MQNRIKIQNWADTIVHRSRRFSKVQSNFVHYRATIESFIMFWPALFFCAKHVLRPEKRLKIQINIDKFSFRLFWVCTISSLKSKLVFILSDRFKIHTKYAHPVCVCVCIWTSIAAFQLEKFENRLSARFYRDETKSVTTGSGCRTSTVYTIDGLCSIGPIAREKTNTKCERKKSGNHSSSRSSSKQHKRKTHRELNWSMWSELHTSMTMMTPTQAISAAAAAAAAGDYENEWMKQQQQQQQHE